MQYVGKVGGYMYNQWTSLNPATLLGAIDIIVIERPDGSYHCSPFHVRFGKFQIIKPLQKKIDLYVNDIKTDLPMKLGEGGEGFFVFETSNNDLLSKSVLTSPVISPTSSPEGSPEGSPRLTPSPPGLDFNNNDSSNVHLNDLDGFDLNNSHDFKSQTTSSSFEGYNDDDIDSKAELSDDIYSPRKSPTPTPSISSRIAFEKARKVTQKLNIPSKIDNNGDMVLDMDGYKPNSQKNIETSDEMLKKIFIEELEKLGPEHNYNDSEQQISIWDQIIKMDQNGNIRISNTNENSDYLDVEENYVDSIALQQQQDFSNLSTSSGNILNDSGYKGGGSGGNTEKTYFKTLRLTSEQLKRMDLHYGENKLMFKLNQGNSQVFSNLFLWKSSTPIVISDIDGTITKSDALGHVLNFIGKDWTHAGVAKLFQDINSNGYNIIYLTARSVGQADSTRAYLQSVVQENGIKLPLGPVILSPDRTIAALRREVILKKPEVFKMSCLNDLKSLYYSDSDNKSNKNKTYDANSLHDDDEDYVYDNEKTPFYAGFGNRITDAISYRSVNIPSHRIFTINPDGDVHLELLELSGVKSSYVGIGELVDQYFPPVNQLGGYSSLSNPNQSNFASKTAAERFNDVNYWREPLNLSDLSDIEDEEQQVEEPKSPSLLSIRSFTSDSGQQQLDEPKTRERPKSISSFASPLKGFNPFNRTEPEDSFDYGGIDDNGNNTDDNYDGKSGPVENILGDKEWYSDQLGAENPNEDDFTDDYDEEEDGEDEEGNVDDEDDDYDEEEDEDYVDEEDEDEDYDEDEDVDEGADDYDDDDIDYDSGLPEANSSSMTEESTSPRLSPNRGLGINSRAGSPSLVVSKASDMMRNMKLE